MCPTLSLPPSPPPCPCRSLSVAPCICYSQSGLWGEQSLLCSAPSLAQQRALLQKLLPSRGWGTPGHHSRACSVWVAVLTDRDTDQTRLCPGLSRGHSLAMRGRLGAWKCLPVYTSRFVCGSPCVGWSRCLSQCICERLGLFMSVCKICGAVWE